MSKAKQDRTRSLYFHNRITQALDGILVHPLTIVEAPMGYGKTTAVREYLNKSGTTALWQRVYDSSPDIFWHGFAKLFKELDEDCSWNLSQLGVPSDGISTQEALTIIQALELPSVTVMVIDDYHLVDSTEVNRFLEMLAESGTVNLHIVVITRFAKFQKLEELALKGCLHYIKNDALEFKPIEIEAYYKECGINIKTAEADRLYSVTEGWISALYLFMLELIAEGSFTPAKNIYGILEKAVYMPLSEEIKEFILSLCIFDSFTYEQAHHMWGREKTDEYLSEIIEKNAFITYESTSKSYHMHSIFTGFLREVLERKPTESRHELYQKAAHWRLKTNDYFDAINYFYKSGDFDSILATLEDEKLTFSYEKEGSLIKYLEECPIEVKARHPFGFLKYAIYLFAHNETALFGKACKEFTGVLEADSSLDVETKNRLSGEYELLISFTAYNNLAEMSRHHRKAHELMDRPAVLLNLRSVWTFGSTSVLYLYYRESGRLKEHVRELEDAMIYYTPLTNGQGSGADYAMEAEQKLFAGDFENAEIAAYKAVDQAQSKFQEGIVICAMFVQMRLAFIKGDFSGVLDILQKLRTDMISSRHYMLNRTVDLCEAHIYALLNQTDKIQAWISAGAVNSSRLMFPAYGSFNIVYGRVLLLKGEYIKLIGSSEQFIRIASVFPNLLGQIYTYIYLAAANKKVFREQDAFSALKQALELAIPDEVYLPFAENGDYIAPMLEKIDLEGGYREDIQKILSLYEALCKSKERILHENFTENKLKLTPREMEIARLAAAGIINNEIGKQLFISENTVKAALKSIYSKLSINSRMQLNQYLDNIKR